MATTVTNALGVIILPFRLQFSLRKHYTAVLADSPSLRARISFPIFVLYAQYVIVRSLMFRSLYKFLIRSQSS